MSNFWGDRFEAGIDRPTWTVWLGEILAIAVGYYLLARLGQLLAIEPGNLQYLQLKSELEAAQRASQ